MLSQFFPRKRWVKTGIPKLSTADLVHKKKPMTDMYICPIIGGQRIVEEITPTIAHNVEGATKPAYPNCSPDDFNIMTLRLVRFRN
jgi:hypothetical protein